MLKNKNLVIFVLFCLCGFQGGGRQRYSDRRERLLKILSHKKRTSGVSSSATNNGTSQFPTTSADQASDDKQIGQQTLDEIMNYIEGKRTNSVCHKKAAKKARQKERKVIAFFFFPFPLPKQMLPSLTLDKTHFMYRHERMKGLSVLIR